MDLRSKVVAPATVAQDLSALWAVLNAAVNADLIARSPARNIALPRVVNPERSGFSPSKLAALVREVAEHYRALVLVGALLGLRWGEQVGLRVRDVDFMPHTVMTAMADAGVPYNVTQARAGQSTARMTMELYSHRTTAADRVAAEALQAHFGEAFAAGSGTSVARRMADGKKLS